MIVSFSQTAEYLIPAGFAEFQCFSVLWFCVHMDSMVRVNKS